MWWFIAFIVIAAYSYSQIPKPQSLPPAGLSSYNVPTAEEGREIPVLFGTKDLQAPNTVWFGDIKAVAIKSKGGKK